MQLHYSFFIILPRELYFLYKLFVLENRLLQQSKLQLSEEDNLHERCFQIFTGCLCSILVYNFQNVTNICNVFDTVTTVFKNVAWLVDVKHHYKKVGCDMFKNPQNISLSNRVKYTRIFSIVPISVKHTLWGKSRFIITHMENSTIIIVI